MAALCSSTSGNLVPRKEEVIISEQSWTVGGELLVIQFFKLTLANSSYCLSPKLKISVFYHCLMVINASEAHINIL